MKLQIPEQYDNCIIETAEDAVKIIRHYFTSSMPRQLLWVIGTEKNKHLLCVELVELGAKKCLRDTVVSILRTAIISGATDLICISNSSCGALKVDPEATEITRSLIIDGDMLGIEVVDHLLISEHSYESLEDTGVLARVLDKEQLPDIEFSDYRDPRINALRADLIRKFCRGGLDLIDIAKVFNISQQEVTSIFNKK